MRLPVSTRTLRLTVKRCASAADRLRPSPSGIVILIYHRVGARALIESDLPRALFEEQMEVLAESRRVVSLDTAVARLTEGRGPEARDPVVITFDDGTEDFTEAALPVLQRLGLPATLYLATNFIETRGPFLFDGRPLSWEAAREAVATGLVTIGAHTHTHPRMDRLSKPAAEEELERCLALIEDRVGIRAEHFAYPYSLLGSPAAESAVKARFRSAALAGSRRNAYTSTDIHRLQRSPIQTTDGMRYFHSKLEGGMWLEDRVRKLAGPRIPD